MATLGELLFYISTQQPDCGSVSDLSAAWGISSATIAGVVRLLKPGEDEVCTHYAAKTIENISSNGGDWAAVFSTQVRRGGGGGGGGGGAVGGLGAGSQRWRRPVWPCISRRPSLPRPQRCPSRSFHLPNHAAAAAAAPQEVVSSLVAVLGSGAGDSLKATAASTLARLLRASPALMAGLVDKYGIGVMLAGGRRGLVAGGEAPEGRAARRPQAGHRRARAAVAGRPMPASRARPLWC
jgi:hypothetical protein